MLNHLHTPQNVVIVTRPAFNRDGDEISSEVIGNGYGLFRAKVREELKSGGDTLFGLIGILTEFTPSSAPIDYPLGFDGQVAEIYNGPQVADYCQWHNRLYYVGGVTERFDIHGVFVGYWLECSDRR